MPTSIQEIQGQIAVLGADRIESSLALQYLPSILAEEEPILALTRGAVDGRTTLVVCTEWRVLVLIEGLITGLKQREMPLERIEAIDHKMGIFSATIIFGQRHGRTQVTVGKQSVRPFIAAVNRAAAALRASRGKDGQPMADSGDDITTQLERLVDLRDRGALTEEEFQVQKARILAS
jgi:hypothetical protein